VRSTDDYITKFRYAECSGIADSESTAWGRDGLNHALNCWQYNFIGVGELTMDFPQELRRRIADISGAGIED